MAPAAAAGTGGLYDSRFEHDACGVGFVADLSGRRSHDTVAKALTVLRNLDHRGAKGSDPDTGDGAGILTQIPDALFRAVCAFALPDRGCYAAGPARSCPPGARGAGGRRRQAAVVERIAAEEGLTVLGWRDVPARPGALRRGRAGRAAAPGAAVRRRRDGGESGLALDRRAFCLRKRAEHETGVYYPEPVLADDRVQGHAHRAAAAAVLPGPVRPRLRLRAGPGALPVLHQHVPVLAAGPPLPLHRAQRRDQHGPGQPQLDAGPRGDAGQRPVPGCRRRARDRAAAADPGRVAPATRPASTSAWNCCTWAAGRCRTPC